MKLGKAAGHGLGTEVEDDHKWPCALSQHNERRGGDLGGASEEEQRGGGEEKEGAETRGGCPRTRRSPRIPSLDWQMTISTLEFLAPHDPPSPPWAKCVRKQT